MPLKRHIQKALYIVVGCKTRSITLYILMLFFITIYLQNISQIYM